MDSRLIRWNTGRVISSQLSNLGFLTNYELVNKELADIYNSLYDYASRNYNGRGGISYGSDLYSDLTKHLDNMIDFQLIVESDDKSIDLGKEATERFQNANVRSTQSVDSQQIARLNLLLEYSKSIRLLFNNVVPLLKKDGDLKLELVSELTEILMNKGLDNFEIPEDLLIKPVTQEVAQTTTEV
tara:strand:- start:225 stop:779 length:555 start_codon:yes stop_codon:yes gene_type:complete